MGRLNALRVLLVAATLLCSLACAGVSIDGGNKTRGVYHRVGEGQTLSTIARAYGVSVLDIVVTNDIRNPDAIETDQILFIPGASAVVDKIGTVKRRKASASTVAVQRPPEKEPKQGETDRPITVSPLPPPSRDTEGRRAAEGGETQRPVAVPPRPEKPSPAKEARTALDTVHKKEEAPPPESPPKPKQAPPKPRPDSPRPETASPVPGKPDFIWPVKGTVTSRFGRQSNGMYYNGVNIRAKTGEPVVSAADGKVTFSAYLRDYGETIIIQHSQQFSTVYAHLGRRMVKQHDRIARGEQIALTATPEKKGDASLNFGIWYRNKAQDPLLFLP